MYLYGASGHAKVVISILKANDMEVTALIDDNVDINSLLGYSVLHGIYNLSPMLICIGDNELRRKVSQKLNVEYNTIVHPSAIVDSSVYIGCGSVVMQGAIVQIDTFIGDHCIINTGAVVDHECKLANFVHISPNSTLCGNVTVQEGAWIAAGAVVLPCINIGKWAIVAAGAVVIEDVPDYAVVAGVPAKIIKYKNQTK